VIVTVTADDIKEGKRGDGFRCPVALAMQRVGISEPIASPERLIERKWMGDEEKYLRRSTVPPDEVRHWIDDFDRGRHVEPFSFTIEFGEWRGEKPYGRRAA
jgi:hypothetical protein